MSRRMTWPFRNLGWDGRRVDGNRNQEPGADHPSSSNVRLGRGKSIKINTRDELLSVTFLDGKHIIAGGVEQKIRVWRAEDGREVWAPMATRGTVLSIVVSSDGRWVVGGTTEHVVNVWSVESHEKVGEFRGHSNCQCVDVSPDGTKIASGSSDFTVRVWSLSTGKELLVPLKHSWKVGAVKFSPDGRLIATATLDRDSVRIYDSQNGQQFLNLPIRIYSGANQSIAWTGDSKQLLSLSCDGEILCFDVSTGKTLSQWPIPNHHPTNPKCIALASNGTFVAVSDTSSVTFWDTSTHEQIGSIIEHTTVVRSVAISANYDIAIAGGKRIVLRSLRDVLPSHYTENNWEQPWSASHVQTESTIQVLDPDNHTGKERKDDRDETVRSPHSDIRTRDESSSMSSGSQTRNSLSSVTFLEQTIQDLRLELASSRTQLIESKREMGNLLGAHQKKHHCEALYASGRVFDAGLALVEFMNTTSEEVRANKFLMDWLADITKKCTSTLEKIGDNSSGAEKYDHALAAYSMILSIDPSAPHNMLAKWANIMVLQGSVNEALHAATKFKLPSFVVYKTLCDVLETNGRIMDAISCFRRMQSELEGDKNMHDERAQWGFTFQWRCAEQLRELADDAMDAQDYDQAAEYLSAILSLDGVEQMNVLVKRSEVRALMESWEDALGDADQAIKLEPSSHLGYERRQVALHGAGRHADAVEAFDMMLLRIDQSPHEDVRKLRDQYHDARPMIRRIVNQTLRYMPSILIDTTTGRLFDKNQQAATFENLPIWNELVSSMTKAPDYARIEIEVRSYYQYVMLSHTWEDDEPRLQMVRSSSVYSLKSSPTNIKLQKFCSLVHYLGFRWAWADTTCVDQDNNVVLQESLVAMFSWYRGSSLTLVYLRGVSSESRLPGGLQGSRWNTRGWTYQEYVAAETVQFYTEDWKPYLGLNMNNHKESLAVISEMQKATGVSAEEMAILRPGLDGVREKLFVASTRQTTRTEDIAYSLLGIFNVAIPIIYGEGDRAVGRLLEHVLTGSGDVSILAWTGRAGSYNSCLPVDLTVYHQLVPPHIPLPIGADEMNKMVMALQSSLPNPSLAVRLYNELKALPSPFLASSRLRLPGIAFRLGKLSPVPEPDPVTKLHVYHAKTSIFGDIVIKTTDDLTGMRSFCILHPWIRPLLDQEFSDGVAAVDETTQALQLVARLQQPFGALMLESLGRVEYRRVAADSLIMIQFIKDISLSELIKNIHTVEIVR